MDAYYTSGPNSPDYHTQYLNEDGILISEAEEDALKAKYPLSSFPPMALAAFLSFMEETDTELERLYEGWARHMESLPDIVAPGGDGKLEGEPTDPDHPVFNPQTNGASGSSGGNATNTELEGGHRG